MSILVMVVQSWEDEARRMRGKICRHAVCCSSMKRLVLMPLHCYAVRAVNVWKWQLIIAAPENISPEKGTTYKLVRKVVNNHEHVHVVGLRVSPPSFLKRCRVPQTLHSTAPERPDKHAVYQVIQRKLSGAYPACYGLGRAGQPLSCQFRI